MATQVLVNVLSITVPGSGSLVVAHGIQEGDKPALPTMIQPDRATPTYVDIASVNTLTATFVNPDVNPATFAVRFVRDLSMAVDPNLAVPLFWQGNPGAASGPAVPAGDVPAPGGPYPAIPANTAVGLSGGAVVPAFAGVGAVQAVGFYSGSATNLIRTSGPIFGLVGLPADTDIYLDDVGGLAAAPPVGAGKISQRVGKSVGTTTLFVEIQSNPTYL